MSTNSSTSVENKSQKMTADEYSTLMAKWHTAYYSWNVAYLTYYKYNICYFD